jgi:ArsR family transcriptional regulator
VDLKEIAGMCKALGDPTRLRIFQFLRSCCGKVALDETGDVCPVDGPTVGDVCCHITGVDKASSTISFHLKELRNAGLITMERRGKHMICDIDHDALARFAAFSCGEATDCYRSE